MKGLARAIGASIGTAVGVYGGWAALSYARYGGPHRRQHWERDELLDRFMPEYDVYEWHTTFVRAPADITLAAAREQDMFDMPLIKAVFSARGWAMGSSPQTPRRQQGLLDTTLGLGWRLLAEVPDREILVGAVTRPWEANVVFRGIAPDEFAVFDEPDYVKIVWTLRADAGGHDCCRFSTETRAIATDKNAARRFRRYWALASPGISLIRRLALSQLKATAEQVSPAAAPSQRPSEPLQHAVR